MEDKLLKAALEALGGKDNNPAPGNEDKGNEPEPQNGEPTPKQPQQGEAGDGPQDEPVQPIKAWEQKVNGRPYEVEMYPDKVIVRDKETGKERELTLEEFASKGIAAEEKFEKAAEIRKSIEQEKSALKQQREELLALKSAVYETGELQALKELGTQLGISGTVFSEFERQLEDAVDDEEKREILDRAKRVVVEVLDKKREGIVSKEREIIQREVLYQYHRATELLAKELGDKDVAQIVATAVVAPILQALSLPPEQRPAELKDVESPADDRVTKVIEKAARNLKAKLVRRQPIETEDDAENALKLIREKYPDILQRYIDEEVDKRLAELGKVKSPPSGRAISEPPKVPSKERPSGGLYEAAIEALRKQGILK